MSRPVNREASDGVVTFTFTDEDGERCQLTTALKRPVSLFHQRPATLDDLTRALAERGARGGGQGGVGERHAGA